MKLDMTTEPVHPQLSKGPRGLPRPHYGRDIALEIERLRNQINRLRRRNNWIDHSTLRTYEDMLESRLQMLKNLRQP